MFSLFLVFGLKTFTGPAPSGTPTSALAHPRSLPLPPAPSHRHPRSALPHRTLPSLRLPCTKHRPLPPLLLPSSNSVPDRLPSPLFSFVMDRVKLHHQLPSLRPSTSRRPPYKKPPLVPLDAASLTTTLDSPPHALKSLRTEHHHRAMFLSATGATPPPRYPTPTLVRTPMPWPSFSFSGDNLSFPTALASHAPVSSSGCHHHWSTMDQSATGPSPCEPGPPISYVKIIPNQ
jgi:hypothetical protein